MSKVRIKNADRHLLEAVSAWFEERLAKDPVIQKAMQRVENLSSENTDEIILCATASLAEHQTQ